MIVDAEATLINVHGKDRALSPTTRKILIIIGYITFLINELVLVYLSIYIFSVLAYLSATPPAQCYQYGFVDAIATPAVCDGYTNDEIKTEQLQYLEYFMFISLPLFIWSACIVLPLIPFLIAVSVWAGFGCWFFLIIFYFEILATFLYDTVYLLFCACFYQDCEQWFHFPGTLIAACICGADIDSGLASHCGKGCNYPAQIEAVAPMFCVPFFMVISQKIE